MPHLAFYTFAILQEPRGHPKVQGFYDRAEEIFASAESADGFVDRRRADRPPDFGPRFYDPATDAGAPQTLSVWTGAEAVFAFAFWGPHAEALRHRTEWVVEPQWPAFVAWWVPDGYLPSWEEGAYRLEYLHDNGPTLYAFTFRHLFDADGSRHRSSLREGAV